MNGVTLRWIVLILVAFVAGFGIGMSFGEGMGYKRAWADLRTTIGEVR